MRRIVQPPNPLVKGFTLIEMMVTLAIIAIVSSIAYPNFMASIRKGRRADAGDAAANVMQAQERWRANNATYTTTLGNLGISSSTTGNGYYTMALSIGAGQTASTGYTITFTPVASKGQNNDTGCTAMSVTVTATNPVYAPATCWSR
jgi:type IV pilus assembly protein PilE